MNQSIDQLMEQKLEQLRTRLLDLSLANRLLNFKHSPQGRSYLRIIDDIPDLLWERLHRRRALAFRSLPPIEEEPEDESQPEFIQAWQTARLSDSNYQAEMQALDRQEESPSRAEAIYTIERSLKDRLRKSLGWPSRLSLITSIIEHAKRHEIDPSFDLPRKWPTGKYPLSENLQLLLLPKIAEQQLSYVRDAAHQRLEETGINMLFCTFGFLQWYETAESTTPLYAPLILLPAEIKRELKQHQFIYTLSVTDEEPIPNLTLKEKLREFGIALPEWQEQDTPESYWQRIEEAIQFQRKWQIRRWITVGIFPFSRMAMYEDLNPSQLQLIHHPQTRDLILGQVDGSSQMNPIPSQEDERIDPLVISKVDSSQYAAICKALQCPSLVIKGPPGTGKSQTITNLIAASIARGENVLFVADKQAALNVVYSRLQEAGIGEFCLELHSHQATRIGVIDSLKKRLDLSVSERSGNLEEKLKEIQEIHHALDQYIHFIKQPLGKSQQTIQNILWTARQASDKGNFPPLLYRTYLEQPDLITPTAVQHAKKLLKNIEKAYAIAIEKEESLYQHPWLGISKAAFSPFQIEELQELFSKLHPLIERLESYCQTFANKYNVKLESFEATDQFKEHLSQALNLAENIHIDILSYCEDIERRRQIEQLKQIMEQLKEIASSLQIDISRLSSFPLASLEKLEALWRSLSSPPASLARLEQELEHMRQQILGLERLLQLCSEIALLFGLEIEELSLNDIQSLWSAVHELAHLPPSLLKKRHPPLYTKDAQKTLCSAQQQVYHLQQVEQELQKQFKMELCQACPELASYAQIFEQGHFLSFLNPSFHRARRFYHSIALQPCSQMKDIANDLRKISNHLSSRKALEQDKSLQVLCGSHFMGIETDFASLAETAQFTQIIQKRFANQNSIHRAICSTLLEGKEEDLQKLAGYIKHPMASALNHFLSSPHDHQSYTLLSFLETWQTYHQNLKEMRSCARESHLPTHFQFENLSTWITKGRLLQHVWKKWEDLQSFAMACNLASLEGFSPSQIEATLSYWQHVRNQASLAPLTQSLLSSSVKLLQEDLKICVQSLQEQMQPIEIIWKEIHQLGGIDEELFFANGQPFAKQNWLDLRVRIEKCLKYPEKLNSWSILGEALVNAKQEKLDIIFRPFLEEKHSLDRLCEAYHMVLYRSLAKHAYTLDHGLLSRFNGIDQEQLISQLTILEQEAIQLSKARLRNLLLERLPPSGIGHGKKSAYTELALIKHEISKQKRHIPIRQLMQRSKEAMRILKPCFLMSPLSLAQYLPRDSIHFDLLVIDEASQMRPEEAIGAISRAKRVVIVGDPMQLPPTDFFMKTESPYLEEEEEEETMSHESILDLALATFSNICELRWHYRSQHESLIAFSNHHFYGNRLIVMPSAHQSSMHIGVKWVPVSGVYQNRLNLIESQAVIQSALEHMEKHPDRSLGIVTLNCSQRDLLLEEFEYAIRQSPQAAAYMARWESTLQVPFIKNLENVQGDERDTILISMVYGPNEEGDVLQQFGPINKGYGHRRLNVLFTRARSHLIVFSSLLPDQIKAEGKNPGVGILKNYLEYASTGRLEIGYASHQEPESDFEKWVAEKIRAMGCKAIPQVGVAGYRIDIGVSHPNYPYGYLLGIECDGATYHSSKEAKERDRLRQDILEKLGWTIYRIWSTDWFRDPVTQAKCLQNFIENLLSKKMHDLTSIPK